MVAWANSEPEWEKKIVYELNEEKIKEILVKYIRAIHKELTPDEDDCEILFEVGSEREKEGKIIFSFTAEELQAFLEKKDENTEDTEADKAEHLLEHWDAELLPCGKDSCPEG